MEGSWLSNPTLEKKDLESIQIILDRMWWDKFLHQGNLDKDKRSLDFGGTDIPRLRTSEAHEGEKAAAGNANLHVFSKKNADQGRA